MEKRNTNLTWTALVLTLALLCLTGVAAAEAPGQLSTVQSGTVSGDLYVKAYQPVPFGNQPSSGVTSRDFDQVFTLPASATGANVAWARLYVNVYSGSGSADWPLSTTVKFDGNGDGTYETTLGTETMQGIGYSKDGTVFRLNDHCERVYSDYLTEYNVAGLISSSNPAVHVRTEQVGSTNYDGRLKAVALVVAYNDGDTDQVRYWVNKGDAWIDSSTAPTTTAFGTETVPDGFTSATLSNLALSSSAGAYTFNGHALSNANPVAPVNYFENPTWDIKNDVTAGEGSTLSMNLGASASSFKTVLATLAVRSPAPVQTPVAAFSGTPTSGTAPLAVQFTDQSTNTPTGWTWEFGDGTTATEQNPAHTYTTAGTYTVNLTATNAGGSATLKKTSYITVTAPAAPTTTATTVSPTVTVTTTGTTAGGDLTVSAGPTSSSSPSPNLFAHYTANTIKATVKNQGSQNVGPFSVAFSVDGNISHVSVAELAAGASTVVSVTDTADRSVGASVPITVTADDGNTIAETNEGNNQYSYTATVIRNGYAGMRWGDGSDITTTKVTTLHGDIISSLGTSAYGSNAATWSASDLPIPAGATVKNARLYITYTWDSGNTMPGAAVTSFNGVTRSYDTFYSDTKNWGGYAYPFGLITYDVTDQFNAAGNSVTTTGIPPIRGMELVVTYEDPTATEKKIFVNEGFDLLYASPTYFTTEETATAYAPFTGAAIDMSTVNRATLTTFINRGKSGSTRGTMLFNGHEWPNYWTMASPAEIGVNTADVTSYLTATGNIAGFRSLIANNMDMEPHLAILKVEHRTETTAPVAAFTANTTNGTAPLAVQFTDTSTGSPTTWSWSFGDGTTATEQSPVHTYTTAGTYTVNLKATSTGGSNTTTKAGFITVSATQGSAPVASFSANTTAGAAPLTVRFTDTSATSPTAWAWDFNNDGVIDSTEQSPIYSYTAAGTYSVKLTVTNASGSNTTIATNAIAVSGEKKPLTSAMTGTVSGDLYVGAYQPVAWSNQPSTPGVKTFSQNYTIPANTGVQWARLYAVVYAAGTDARAGQATVSFDGNGDGTYETPLGTEELAIPGSANGYAYQVNDHTNRVYSDYMMWYDVTDTISASTVNARIQTENQNGSAFDGRLKTLTLVVAYNDGDTDLVRYFVNDGHEYQGSTDAGTQTTFATAGLPAGWSQATLSNIHLSSKDAAYTFNSHAYTGTKPVSPFASFACNTWNVTDSLTAGSDSTLAYTHAAGSSYKTPLAILTVKYPATPVTPTPTVTVTTSTPTTTTVTPTQTSSGHDLPVADFSVTYQSGPGGMGIQVTDASVNATSVKYDLGDGTTTTYRNFSYIYWQAGTYTITLTATNDAGSSTKTLVVTVPVVPVTTTTTVTPDQQYNGPHNAPGTVQAEDYDLGGEGVAYHDTTARNEGGAYRTDDVDIEAGGSGYDVGWIIDGESLTYSVDAATAGTYPVALRAANPDGTAKTVTVSAGSSSTTISVASTGSFDTYNTFTSAGAVSLAAGRNLVKVTFGASRMNLDYITIGTGAEPAPETASFTVSPTSGKRSLTVALTDTTTGGSPVSWKWSCGNGQTFSGRSIGLNRIWYNYPGTFTITLTVTDADGSVRTATKTITVTS